MLNMTKGTRRSTQTTPGQTPASLHTVQNNMLGA
jgi:hypothetical protein